jgi:hypothetical protein
MKPGMEPVTPTAGLIREDKGGSMGRVWSLARGKGGTRVKTRRRGLWRPFKAGAALGRSNGGGVLTWCATRR